MQSASTRAMPAQQALAVFAGDEAPDCASMVHGETVRDHYHDFGQLRYAASGVLVTSTNEGTWMAPANRMAWVPPFHVHGSRSYGETEIRLLNVSAALAHRLPAQPCVFVASALMREAFLALIHEPPPIETSRMELLLEVIGAELRRAPKETLRLPDPIDRRLKAVTSLLRSDPASPATLAELGRKAGASERTLSRLFSSELSMSFHQWRTLLRIQCALTELADGTSITETAMRLGWSNPSGFIEAFTELVGETPGRYRTLARASQGGLNLASYSHLLAGQRSPDRQAHP